MNKTWKQIAGDWGIGLAVAAVVMAIVLGGTAAVGVLFRVFTWAAGW